MQDLPQVRVSFFFTGDEFSINNVTNAMKVQPTYAREKKDFPIQQIAKTTWVLETDKESCKAVAWQFEKLLRELGGKERIINHICNENGISAEFCVTVWMENGDKPEMVLTKEIISFLASINAEVGFDLYID